MAAPTIRAASLVALMLIVLTIAAAGQYGAEAKGNSSSPRPYKKSKLSYYVQVVRGTPSLAFLLQPLNATYSNGLGLTIIFALNMTETAALDSRVIGVARGYSVDVSYTGHYSGFETEVLGYDDGVYKGSIHFQALLDGSDPAEVAVLGGTGSFRGVTGWGLIHQVLLNPPYVVYHHTLHFTNSWRR